jgi:hypothetical protein
MQYLSTWIDLTTLSRMDIIALVIIILIVESLVNWIKEVTSCRIILHYY